MQALWSLAGLGQRWWSCCVSGLPGVSQPMSSCVCYMVLSRQVPGQPLDGWVCDVCRQQGLPRAGVTWTQEGLVQTPEIVLGRSAGPGASGSTAVRYGEVRDEVPPPPFPSVGSSERVLPSMHGAPPVGLPTNSSAGEVPRPGRPGSGVSSGILGREC